MFCPGCGNQMAADARFCPSCGRPNAVQVQQAPRNDDAGQVLLWVASAVVLVGFAWLWLNVGDASGLVLKLVIVGFMGAIWTGAVFTVLAVVALLLGMVGVMVSPFRRK